nr:HK97-gp10 family putative phage morphogenesis protein [Serratia marcescens]
MAELARRLEAIRREVASHILPEAGHAALAPLLSTMQQCAERGASNSEPSLSAGIAIRPAVTGWNAVTLRVGPSKQHYHRALAQEYGTATQAAAPFIRPALDHHKHQVLRILAAHVRYGIENR